MTYKLVRNFAVCAAFTLFATSAVAEEGFPKLGPIKGESIDGSGGEDRLTENLSLNGGGGKVAVQDLSLRDPQVLTGLGFFAFIAALSAASGSK